MDTKGRPGWRSMSDVFGIGFGLKSHAGLFMGGGISSDPIATAVTSQKMASFYTKANGDGDSEGLYWRHYIGKAGAGGEAGRFFATVDNVAASNAFGAHVSLSFGTSGKITGLGLGLRGTLHVPFNAGANPISAGTYAAQQSELFFDTGTGTNLSDLAAATEHAIHRFLVDGDATAKAKALNVMSFVGLSSGAGKMFHTNTQTATHRLRVIIDGTAYGILLTNVPG